MQQAIVPDMGSDEFRSRWSTAEVVDCGKALAPRTVGFLRAGCGANSLRASPLTSPLPQSQPQAAGSGGAVRVPSLLQTESSSRRAGFEAVCCFLEAANGAADDDRDGLTLRRRTLFVPAPSFVERSPTPGERLQGWKFPLSALVEASGKNGFDGSVDVRSRGWGTGLTLSRKGEEDEGSTTLRSSTLRDGGGASRGGGIGATLPGTAEGDGGSTTFDPFPDRQRMR